MKSSRRALAIGKLLDLCDDLQRIRARLHDPELRREERMRLRRQSKRKAMQLQRDLGAYRFRGPLGMILREYRFTPADFEILSALLHHSMRSPEPELEGRILLGTVFETAFGVLQGMHHLQESGRLRSSGLVVLADEAAEETDVLEARFRLSDDALQSFREEVEGRTPADLRRRRNESYRHHRELLTDLRILHNLYKTRSEQVFHGDRWDRLHVGTVAPGRFLSRRIQAFWDTIRTRIAATPAARDFPVLRLQRECGLCEEELVMIVHLFFRELYEGNAYADAVELLRLVSANEQDLIRNRRLLLKQSPLVQGEILNNEPLLEGRELTGEVHLSDWVVNLLFGAEALPDREIRPDDRLEWHLYLKNLEDTGSFFRDLDSN